MKKEFIIRIDLESQRGIREGLPKLLKLFKKYDIRSSFYLTMGGESNIFEILWNRKKLKTSGERKINLWSNKDKLRMLLCPVDFVKNNKILLRKITSNGHELGLHGWKHREWTRNLEKVNIKKRLKQMIFKYKEYFGRNPISWTSPGFNINKKVLEVLGIVGIKYISDFDKKGKVEDIINVPITVCGKDRMPFIEYWVGKGKTDEEIFEIFRKEIDHKNFVSFYLHGMFEGRFKIDLLEKMILELKRQKFNNKRVIDIR